MTETIIVGYEEKEPARRALDRAVEEAKARKAHLIVVTILDLPLDPNVPRNYGTLDDGPFTISADEPPELEGALAAARSRIEADGLPADYMWAVGDPARTIVDLARERHASLIVVGAHHEGFLSHFLTPGVDELVQRDAGCDVVVVS